MSRAPRVSVALCDDDADFRDLMCESLRRSDDFLVMASAETVDELLDTLRVVQADVILLDLVMPEVQGGEAIDRVREAVPDAVIVVVSAVVRSSGEHVALPAGADAYVEKGPGATEIIDRVREAVAPLL